MGHSFFSSICSPSPRLHPPCSCAKAPFSPFSFPAPAHPFRLELCSFPFSPLPSPSPPPTHFPTQSMSQQSLCREASSAQSAMFNPEHRWLMRHCGDVKHRGFFLLFLGEQQLTCGGAAPLPRLQDSYWQALYQIINVISQRDER